MNLSGGRFESPDAPSLDGKEWDHSVCPGPAFLLLPGVPGFKTLPLVVDVPVMEMDMRTVEKVESLGGTSIKKTKTSFLPLGRRVLTHNIPQNI